MTKKKYHSTQNQVIVGRKSNKSKGIAALLAFIFGGIGIHKFYLGQVGWGLMYILFSWSCIPMIAGFIEGFIYLTMSKKDFEAKYA